MKIRGYRIEPGEIVAKLCEHAFVREAVVVARQSRAGDKHLIAYVVGAPEAGEGDGGGLAGALRAHLSSRLPDYMVPAVVRADRGAAADAERQARPQRAAGAGR
ncbi:MULTISPECIES: AMP-binding enzyme [Bradyrhizobium]|uniref:AMP-binding enzyme n=1 Tax=Bradyrhizobium TaxID=374 RepID=UPI001FDA043B|nr:MULTISPECIES: hypothetical protein [Bradyrhizobium]MCP1986970.1 acyl-coenzyme A synthetase/AMP-(fatty) acid ligase [Bradyrhizobium sp. USDA 4539]